MYQNINVFNIDSGSRRDAETSRDSYHPIVTEPGHSDCLEDGRRSRQDPFSPYCIIPLPTPFGLGLLDASCFRRRNERERERVRCVNEGYIRLKQHLPIENKDKRISKVDTLRGAIQYIKHLENILQKDRNNKKVRKSVLEYKPEVPHCSSSALGRTSTSNYRTNKDSNRWPQSYEQDSDYDMLNYSSDYTDVSSDAESYK